MYDFLSRCLLKNGQVPSDLIKLSSLFSSEIITTTMYNVLLVSFKKNYESIL